MKSFWLVFDKCWQSDNGIKMTMYALIYTMCLIPHNSYYSNCKVWVRTRDRDNFVTTLKGKLQDVICLHFKMRTNVLLPSQNGDTLVLTGACKLLSMGWFNPCPLFSGGLISRMANIWLCLGLQTMLRIWYNWFFSLGIMDPTKAYTHSTEWRLLEVIYVYCFSLGSIYST